MLSLFPDTHTTTPDTTPALPKTVQELTDRFHAGEIASITTSDGKTLRLFFSTNNRLCYFKPRSTRKGFYIDQYLVNQIVSFKGNASEAEKQVNRDKENFKMIQKFKKQAQKASFTNTFIRQCLALPDTYEQWEADGKKCPYEYGITTGCSITGKLVSVKSIAAKIGNDHIITALENKYPYSSRNFEFNGYDGSVSFETSNGEFKGYLSQEYRNCGNGYYYLLINEEYFIGYDKD
jgi:hypothetical protein